MGNPFTHIKDKKTKAEIVVGSIEEAIDKYKIYFEKSLELNEEFRKEFERMIDACMTYDTVWIGCYCPTETKMCHGEYIIERLEQECRKRMIQNLLKDKLNEDSSQRKDSPS